MTPDDSQYTAMVVIWTIILGIVLLVLVPAALYRARRLVVAARTIDATMKLTLQAAGAVVGNTAPTRNLLGQTIGAAGAVLATAGQIDAHTAAIEGVLAGRAAART